MIDQVRRIAGNYQIIDVINQKFQIEEFGRKKSEMVVNDEVDPMTTFWSSNGTAYGRKI
jgi:hypothetical protein